MSSAVILSKHLVYFVLVVTCGSKVHGKSLPGADIGYFWHVTDFHYDDTYWGDGLSCNDEVPVKGQWGDYWCDSNWALVSDSIEAMDRIKPDVDFLIWTGDSVAHIKDKDLSLVKNQEIITNLTDKLNTTFPGKSVYASLGNHDFYPSDQANPVNDDTNDQLADKWAQWIGDPEQRSNFKKGGYYIVQVQSNLRLIALNTNFYYHSNKVTKNMTDPAGQMKWLEDQLTSSRDNNQKVIITGHVPVGVAAPGLADWFHPQYTNRYLDIIYRFADTITAMHFGHNHEDNFGLLQKDVNTHSSVTQFMAPSVTPWRFKIPNLTGSPHNPGIRLIKYDRQTGKHLDFDQYFFNLTQRNNGNISGWTKLYTFSEAYKVPDMSVTSLKIVFNRISEGNSEEGRKYCKYSLVSEHDKLCTAEKQAEIYCGGLHSTLDKAIACKTNLLSSAYQIALEISLLIAAMIVLYSL